MVCFFPCHLLKLSIRHRAVVEMLGPFFVAAFQVAPDLVVNILSPLPPVDFRRGYLWQQQFSVQELQKFVYEYRWTVAMRRMCRLLEFLPSLTPAVLHSFPMWMDNICVAQPIRAPSRPVCYCRRVVVCCFFSLALFSRWSCGQAAPSHLYDEVLDNALHFDIPEELECALFDAWSTIQERHESPKEWEFLESMVNPMPLQERFIRRDAPADIDDDLEFARVHRMACVWMCLMAASG